MTTQILTREELFALFNKMENARVAYEMASHRQITHATSREEKFQSSIELKAAEIDYTFLHSEYKRELERYIKDEFYKNQTGEKNDQT